VKAHVSFRIHPHLAIRLRNLVDHNRGAPLFLTVDGFVEAELDEAVTDFERIHNNGKPYPARPRRKK
jgi:hypothetical protein